MFTGIVRRIGRVEANRGGRLSLRAGLRAGLGDSVAVNGVCLTVARRRGAGNDLRLEFDLGPETLRLTTLGGLRTGDPVNLEPALRAADPLGGHLVSGHVDAQARIVGNAPRQDGSRTLRVELPGRLAAFVASKGSIAVDGVSLTVTRVRASKNGRSGFEVMLIPHTLAHTTLGRRKPGDAVNLEVDLLARYVHRILASRRGARSAPRPRRPAHYTARRRK